MAVGATLEMAKVLQEPRVLIPSVDLPAGGLPIRIQWNSVAGASDTEIDSATASIGPSTVEQNLGTLTVSVQDDGKNHVVTVPAGKRIRYLTLNDLKADDGAPVTSSAELPAGRRLAVTVETGGPVPAPQYSVPPVAARGMVPQTLTGASFNNKVLGLPDVAGARIRLTLVEKDVPEEFNALVKTLDTVSGVAAVLPKNLSLVEPDGATAVWSFPNEMPEGTPLATADLRMSLKKLIAAALPEGQPLDFTFLLKGDMPARVLFHFPGARGALLRTFPGILPNKLAGDPVTLALDGPPLAAEQPGSVTADLTVKYEGLRILESVSDPLPAAAGNVGGLVVGEEPELRAFPPAAFDELAPARLGVVGCAPVDCELSVQLVELEGGSAGRPIAPPGVVRLAASHTIGTVWVDLPTMPPPAKPLGCTAHASKGRFLWAAGEIPLIRVAVRDPDPGGRALRINGVTLMNVTTMETHIAGRALPAAQFRNTAPVLASDLFLKVDLSDLTLRYAR